MPNKELRFGLSLALLAAMLLAGCAGQTEPAAVAQGAPAAPSPAAPPRPTFAVKASQPDELMGKTPKGLRALMGTPSLLRKDHGAEVWQYAGQSCVLFAYLYPNAKGVLEVSYLDARRKTAGAMPVPDCLTALASDGTARPTS
jgi:hypothetical protein